MNNTTERLNVGSFKNKIIIFIFLILIFSIALFFRTYFPYGTIYSDGIVKYGDDAMYHMRNLENMLLGNHFPSSIYFDPFTNFPHGTYNRIAPLYDFILAAFIWLISFGKPTLEIINRVAPFYPAVLGSFISIIIYFIAKAIWNDSKTALAAAFLAAISPAILFKSLLGYNDHHVAEILFSSLSMMFLFYVLRSAKGGISIKNKKLWFFVVMTGFSMGLYLLSWAGAILFFFIIFAFLSTYYLIEFIYNRPANWILISGAIIFLISFLMVCPFFGHPDFITGTYSVYHLLCFGLGLFGFFILWLSSCVVKKRKYEPWRIIIFLTIFSAIFLLLLRIFLPYAFERMIILLGGINNNGIADYSVYKNYIGEMKPLNFQGAIDNFFSLFFVYLIGFAIIVYEFLKQRTKIIKPEYLLLIIWSVITLLITGIFPFFGQMRFSIYLAVNVCLLSAFVLVNGFRFGRESLDLASRLEKSSPIRKYFLVGSITIICGLFFAVIFPFPFNAGAPTPKSLPDLFLVPMTVAKSPFTLSGDWYATLKWLREKTPDPGLDYYAMYQEPGVNKKTGETNNYSYPKQAYGILADWDFGHAIEYYSHRMAIANPFQQGVGKKENGKITEVGSGIFFLETDEDKAITYLDQLKAKYIITESNFAILDTGFFDAMIKWVQGNMDGYLNEPETSLTKYDNSMIARLHLLDGSSAEIGKKVNEKNIDLKVEPLKHFRLLYESDTTVRTLSYKDMTRDIKGVKVFEYVKGVHIIGKIIPGAEISISTDVMTNQGKKFNYEQSFTSQDGSFEFIVPYSTQKQENSDILASDYTIKIGNYTRTIKVSEDDVLQGKTIKVIF